VISKNLKPYVIFWQDVLGLSEWEVRARYVREIPPDNTTCAQVEMSFSTKDAEIEILRYRYRSDRVVKQDYEIDLVHELLHLWLDPIWKLKDGSMAFLHKEQFIESMARCLVYVRRAGNVEVPKVAPRRARKERERREQEAPD